MSTRFEIFEMPLAGLKVIQRKPIGDHRGYMERMFCTEEFRRLIPGKNIVQINHSLTTTRGTVRGMHFQHPPHAEVKVISCMRGEVFDVAVDLRADSPTFLHWHGEILDSRNHRTLLIPEGFAHGFQTLSENCELLYFHTAAWQQDHEGGVSPLDPAIAIQWPETIAEMSPRDSAHPPIAGNFAGVTL